MKIKNVLFLFFLFILQPHTQFASTIIDEDLNSSAEKTQEQAAMIAFANVATTSNNEAAINQIYGPSGLKIAPTDLDNIKKAYCYLEFLFKLDKIKNDASLAQYTSDFKDFLNPGLNNMPLKPTETLVASQGWQAIKVDAKDIRNSPAWQSFIKAMICDIVDNEAEFILNTKDTNHQLFIYIPNIEQAYSDDTFTKMRLYNESIELQALMQYEQKQRYLNQCNDWKDMSPAQLLKAMAQFKKTDLYNYTHNAQATKSTIDPKTGKPYLITIPSPVREQLLSYFMLLHIQTTIQDLMNHTNAESMIQQTSSDLLSPNFLLYQMSDLIYFNDLFTAQELRDKNKENPINSTLAMQSSTSTTTNSTNSVKIQSIDTADASKEDTASDPNQLAASIFEQLPTTSIYEIALEQIYGKSGLNISDETLVNLKKTYCYLEFLIKIDKVRNDQKFNHYQKTDFKDFTQANATQVHLPNQALVTSRAWQEIPVTQQDVLTSQAWQNFIKSMICDCVDSDKTFIVENGEMSHQIFTYLPNIETAYSTKEYTQMRLFEESTRLHTLMQTNQKKRYLEQCSDWKNIDDNTLNDAITSFKKTDFYINTHGSASPSDKNATPSIPLAEQIVSYFAMITIQENLYETLNLNNLSEFLKQSDHSELLPSLFTYTSSDFIYLYDFLTLKILIDQNKNSPDDDVISMQATDTNSSQDNVKVQSFARGFNKAFDPKKNGFNKAFDPAKNGFNNAFDPAKNGFNNGVKGMVTGVMQFSNDLATAFIVVTAGTVWAACSFAAAFPGSKVNPAAEKARCTKYLNKHKAVIAGVLFTVFVTCVLILTIPTSIIASPVIFGAGLTAVLVDKRVSDAMMEAASVLMSPIMQGMAIMTDAMTTGFIELSVGLTWCAYSYASCFDPSINVQQEMNRVRAKLEKYRSTINIVMSVIVTIVASVAFFVCTGGAGLPAIAGLVLGTAINIGFGVFDIMATKGQDDAAAQAAKQERDSIQALWKFVEDNKVSSVQNQNLFMDELHKKHQAAIANQTFGLNYYENFLNSSVSMVQSQIAQALTQQQIQMLTPDNNGLRIADIGSPWGLQTPFTYLYPSQGFISTTLGRPDFPYAQEIAQAPLASKDNNKKIDFSDNQPAATKLWFNQRAISTLKQPADKPLNVEIRFRILYNLDTAYHVGLYLGGNYHDYESPAYLQSIEDTNTIDLDEARLAKMFVLKRDNDKSAPSLGLYENEGKGWITQEPVNPDMLNTAGVYHMSAQLNQDQLIIKFWSEDNPAEKWTKTTTVTPCDQRTFGVIFSGIAIEWGVVRPNQPIIQNKNSRIASNGQSEADRERAAKAQRKQIMNPEFGSMTMESFGMPAILKGQYIYTTQSNELVDGQGNPMTDYMIFATTSDDKVTNIGANPAPADIAETPNSAISLITGNVYNSSGKIITHMKNALDVYAQKSSVISPSLREEIAQASKEYQQQLLSFRFGDYQLEAVDADAVHDGLFIYTCPNTITPTGTTINPILDYLIMADLVNGSLGSTVGMPPSNSVKGMISLITGNVYDRTSPTPIDGGYSQLTQYTKQYGQLPPNIENGINNSLQAYNNTIAPEEQATQQAPVSVVASQTMSFSDLMNTLPPSTGGFEFGLSKMAPSNIVVTKSSLSKLQAIAAGNAKVEFNNTAPAGNNFDNEISTNKNDHENYSNDTEAIPEDEFDNLSRQPVPTPHTSSSIPVSPDAIDYNEFELAGSSGLSF